MKRFAKFLTAVLPFLAALGIQLVVAGILSALYSFMVGFKVGISNAFKDAPDSPDIAEQIQYAISEDVLYLCSVAAILACAIIFFFWYRNEIKGETRGSFKDVLSLKNISLFVVLAIGCQFFLTGLMSFLSVFLKEIFLEYAEVINKITSGNAVLVVLLAIFIAPVAEELIFRGMILHKANRLVSFVGANLLQAVLFGIYHGNIVQGIYATLLGFLFGIIYYKYRSIVAPIILHMMINASAFLTYLIPQSNLTSVIIMFAGGIFTVAAIIIIKPKRVMIAQTVIKNSNGGVIGNDNSGFPF